MSKQVAVIGAGITGITTAYSLAKAGYAVTVYDKHPYAAMQTSYANGGQLSVSNSEVWTTLPTLWKGMKWMLKKDAPLLFNPTPSWRKAKWVGGFLMETIAGNYEKNTLETIRLGLRARELYYEIADAEGFNFDLEKRGILHFYRDEKYLKAAEASCALFRSAGVDRHMVTASEVATIEPALANTHGIIGGTYTPEDASGDIHKFCVELAKVLETKYGVVFQYDSEVTKIESFPNRVDLKWERKVSPKDWKPAFGMHSASKVVICAGVDSPDLAKLAGETINIYPVKGYSITVGLQGKGIQAAPWASLLDEQTKIVASRLGDDRFRVAGTAELADYNYDIRADRVKPLVDWVRRNFPDVSVEDVKPWAGLRPMTPSMLPIVRASKKQNVFLNTGHGHLGWTLSPATAEAITYEILRSA